MSYQSGSNWELGERTWGPEMSQRKLNKKKGHIVATFFQGPLRFDTSTWPNIVNLMDSGGIIS